MCLLSNVDPRAAQHPRPFARLKDLLASDPAVDPSSPNVVVQHLMHRTASPVLSVRASSAWPRHQPSWGGPRPNPPGTVPYFLAPWLADRGPSRAGRRPSPLLCVRCNTYMLRQPCALARRDVPRGSGRWRSGEGRRWKWNGGGKTPHGGTDVWEPGRFLNPEPSFVLDTGRAYESTPVVGVGSVSLQTSRTVG